MIETHEEWLAKQQALVWFGADGQAAVLVPLEEGGGAVSWGCDLEAAIEDHLVGRTEHLTVEAIRACGFLAAFRYCAQKAQEKRLRDAA